MSDALDAEILAYLSGGDTDAEAEAMDARLRSEPAAARRFAELCQHEMVLARILRRSERAKGITSAPLPRVRRGRRPVTVRGPWMLAAAALVLLAGGAWWQVRSAMPDHGLGSVPAGPVHVDVLAEESLVAVLDAVSGEAFVEHDGTRTVALNGMSIQPGDRIVTAVSAVTEPVLAVVLSDGSHITCAAGTILELPRSGRRFVVPFGTLDAEVAHQPAGYPIRFASPIAEAEVVGTHLHLVVDPQATRLEVSAGSVRLTRLADRAAVVVPAGSTATAAADRALRVESLTAPRGAIEPLPPGAAVVWSEHFSRGTAGWIGDLDSAEGADGISIRSRLEQPHTHFFAEIRSPRSAMTIIAGETTYLRFRYRTEGFRASDLLKVMPKLADESNFGAYIRPQRGLWATATVTLGGDFEFLNDRSRRLAPGDVIRSIVFLGTANDDTPHSAATVWIDDLVVFTTSGPVHTEPLLP